jgi:hypothetical protein
MDVGVEFMDVKNGIERCMVENVMLVKNFTK